MQDLPKHKEDIVLELQEPIWCNILMNLP